MYTVEPNAFEHSAHRIVSADELATDFKLLRDILKESPEFSGRFPRSVIIGPSTTRPKTKSLNYLLQYVMSAYFGCVLLHFATVIVILEWMLTHFCRAQCFWTSASQKRYCQHACSWLYAAACCTKPVSWIFWQISQQHCDWTVNYGNESQDADLSVTVCAFTAGDCWSLMNNHGSLVMAMTLVWASWVYVTGLTLLTLSESSSS